MNDLMIKIEERIIGTEKVQSVNARELHERLEVGRDFSTWVKQRLEDSLAVDGQDFIVIPKMGDNPQGGRPFLEYYISMDIAKHIAMLERTEIGRKVRQYFIDVEKKTKSVVSSVLTVERQAVEAYKAYKEIGDLMQLPPSVIVSEASKIVDRKYGTNLIEYSKSSPLLDNIKTEEEYLEPTELGKKLGISAIVLNRKLEALGLQTKEKRSWEPTKIGKEISFKHQWVMGNKTGYNLKWNVNKIMKMI